MTAVFNEVISELKIKRKDLRKIGLWQADSISGIALNPEQYLIIKPRITFELEEV